MDIPGPQASTSLTTPKTLTFGKKGRVLHGQAREIVAHVINFMKSEAEHLKTNEQPEIPFQNFKERTRTATGISERMYKRVLKESKLVEAGELSPLSSTVRKRKVSSHVHVSQEQEFGESEESDEEVICKQEETGCDEEGITIKHEPVESELYECIPSENNDNDRLLDEKPLITVKNEPIENEEISEYYPPEKVFIAVKKGETKVPAHYSHPASNTNKATTLLHKKKRGENKTWLFVANFPNIHQAEEQVRAEKTWSILSTHITSDGKKRFYRCNKVKRSGPQCSAQIYLLFSAHSDSVLLHRVDSGHNHDSISTQSDYGITDDVKTEINKLFDLHMKPKAIMSRLSAMRGIKLPSAKQLNNYLSVRRRGKCDDEAPTLSLGELETWLASHSEVPDDVHECFVIGSQIFQRAPLRFRFVLSTKHLLKIAACCVGSIHVGVEYKLVWQGFPVLTLGTSDKEKKFHPLCIGVTSEHQEDFAIFFSGLKQSVFSLYARLLEPVLVYEGAEGIKNAFGEVFGRGGCVRMCWAHAKKLIEARVEEEIENKSVRRLILEDIEVLQVATSREVFNVAAQLFVRKWKKESRFLAYFEEEWLGGKSDWFLGVAPPGSPESNNALEAFNRTIQNTHKLRERLPLSLLLVALSELVNEWSLKNPEESFSKTPPALSVRDWSEACQWAKIDKEIKLIGTSIENNIYLVAEGGEEEGGFELNNWRSFDEFKEKFFLTWQVILPKEKNDWMGGSCSCPEFFRKCVCKHVLGVALRLKYVAAPPLAASGVGEKRKRGRPPAKSRRALIVQ